MNGRKESNFLFFEFCGVRYHYCGKRKLFSPHGSPINTSKFTRFYYSNALHPVIAVFSYCFWNHTSQTKANTSSTPLRILVLPGGGGEGKVRESAPPVNSSEFLVLLSFTSQMSANWVKQHSLVIKSFTLMMTRKSFISIL